MFAYVWATDKQGWEREVRDKTIHIYIMDILINLAINMHLFLIARTSTGLSDILSIVKFDVVIMGIFLEKKG